MIWTVNHVFLGFSNFLQCVFAASLVWFLFLLSFENTFASFLLCSNNCLGFRKLNQVLLFNYVLYWVKEQMYSLRKQIWIVKMTLPNPFPPHQKHRQCTIHNYSPSTWPSLIFLLVLISASQLHCWTLLLLSLCLFHRLVYVLSQFPSLNQSITFLLSLFHELNHLSF